MLPYSFETNDARFWRGGLNSVGDFYEYLKDTFDVLYEEGRTHPKMMSVGLHCRIAGRPARPRALDLFLRYAKSLRECGSRGVTRLRGGGWRSIRRERCSRAVKQGGNLARTHFSLSRRGRRQVRVRRMAISLRQGSTHVETLLLSPRDCRPRINTGSQ